MTAFILQILIWGLGLVLSIYTPITSLSSNLGFLLLLISLFLFAIPAKIKQDHYVLLMLTVFFIIIYSSLFIGSAIGAVLSLPPPPGPIDSMISKFFTIKVSDGRLFISLLMASISLCYMILTLFTLLPGEKVLNKIWLANAIAMLIIYVVFMCLFSSKLLLLTVAMLTSLALSLSLNVQTKEIYCSGESNPLVIFTSGYKYISQQIWQLLKMLKALPGE